MKWRWWRRDEREDVESKDGKVTFNHLQQSEPEPDLTDCCEPAVVTTDPWGITEETGS